MRRKAYASLLAVLCGLVFTGPCRAGETAARYSFGVLPQRSIVLTAQYWNPILEYVARVADVGLDLKVARTGTESAEAVGRGDYDFVYSNHMFQPRLATANYQVILRPQEDAITGQLVTLADSPINSLHELAGKDVGFPSAAAFAGYALPMDHLLQLGITVTPVFGSNQEGIMAQLKAGMVIAAGVNSQAMRDYASRENLHYRVLWESSRFLNIPIAAHPRVPKAVVAAVRKALDDMDNNAEGMRILESSARLIGQKPPYGFRAASPSDYRNYTDFYRSTLLKEFK